jgi:hypothetical protein
MLHKKNERNVAEERRSDIKNINQGSKAHKHIQMNVKHKGLFGGFVNSPMDFYIDMQPKNNKNLKTAHLSESIFITEIA